MLCAVPPFRVGLMSCSELEAVEKEADEPSFSWKDVLRIVSKLAEGTKLSEGGDRTFPHFYTIAKMSLLVVSYFTRISGSACCWRWDCIIACLLSRRFYQRKRARGMLVRRM